MCREDLLPICHIFSVVGPTGPPPSRRQRNLQLVGLIEIDSLSVVQLHVIRGVQQSSSSMLPFLGIIAASNIFLKLSPFLPLDAV